MAKQLYDKNHNSFYPLTDALSVTDTRLNKNQQEINQEFESKLSGQTGSITESKVNSLISSALNDVVKSINNNTGAITLKNINGQSLVGNGNITVTGNVTLDSVVTTTSTNGVTSAGIATYVSNALNAFKPTWNAIVNKPTTFTPTSHKHQSADITDFTGAVEEIIKNTDMACTCPLASASQNGLLSSIDYQLLQKIKAEYEKSNLTIISFTATPNSVTKNKQTSITFNWKVSEGYTLNSVEIVGGSLDKTLSDPTVTSYTLETSLSSDTIFVLTIKSGDKTDTATCAVKAISDTSKVYVGGIDQSYSSKNITATAIKTVNSFDCSKGGTVTTTVKTSTTQKILVAYPTSYGTPTFTESVFSADFSDWETGTITIDSIEYTYHITDVVTPTDGSDYKLVFNN